MVYEGSSTLRAHLVRERARGLSKKGPGAAAGVQQGDIIVTWNGDPIRQLQSLLRALGPDSVGQTVMLGLRRGRETKQVPLTIAQRPAS